MPAKSASVMGWLSWSLPTKAGAGSLTCSGMVVTFLSVVQEVSAICGAMTRETMEASLMRMFMAGPEVSLKGSPTVSPVTDALWASEPL